MNIHSKPSLIAAGAVATLVALSAPLNAQVYTFGSANGGLAGFTQSTPPDGEEIWTTQAESVQYRNQNPGTRNSSFLLEIPLDRSAGKSYRIEGVVALTDGYADDNNRVGLYLFGDVAAVENEDEVGAIGLIFNTDDDVVGGPPGDNTDDDIALRVGIDSPALTDDVPRNEANTEYAQDLFGTEITLAVDIHFLEGSIQVDASLTDAGGAVTVVSTTVPAAEYTGDYFGFITRARARNIDTPGDPRSAPWVMDYRSFSVADISGANDFVLSISPTEGTPGSFDFSWKSQGGKMYDLVSSPDLSSAPDTWPVHDGRADLIATPPTNTLDGVTGGGGPRRFFAVVEKDTLQMLNESFEGPGPDLPTGWVADNATTVWEVGDPASLPNLQGHNPAVTNYCAGTNVVDGFYADEIATVRLTSPPSPIPAGGATLSFRQYIDSDALGGDFGTIRLLDANDTEIVEGDFPVTPIDAVETGWTNESYTLPPSAAGQAVKVVFELTTGADGIVYNGFYIDDVVLNPN